MTAIRAASPVTYTVLDANGSDVSIIQGQPLVVGPLVPTSPNNPTVLLRAMGTTVRLTQANATAWGASGPASGTSFIDADGDLVLFTPPQPNIDAGGSIIAAGTGLRVRFGGVFVDLTSTNLSDLGTPLTAFGSSGTLS